jgi:acetylornithine deacetylase/succinyl-diaminopimelate desuccinylase-like protein
MRRFGLVAGMFTALFAARAAAQGVRMQDLQDEAVRRVPEYLRVNTVNPPGNESRGVEFFRRIFDAEGIAYETVESAPGRGNIWARLDGGPEPALVLMHHMDVVPADAEYWEVDPMAGIVRDGFVWGRGALDTKALGILQLEAFLELKRSGAKLDRPVIFLATADEEAGGFFGAGWLVKNRPEIFRNVGFLLNEGGGGSESGGRRIFEVEVTQKVPVWLRLTSKGEPGHGSLPHVTSSVTQLVRALDNLRRHTFEPHIVPAVDSYFKARAKAGMGPFADRLADITAASRDPQFMLSLQRENPFLAAITRNTCSITRLEGSSKINVVPPQASAELDCRLLPDQDVDAFIATLRTVIDDPSIGIETIMAFSPAVSSTDTDLYRSLERVIRNHFPKAAVLPSVQSGFTDSHFTRDLGIVSYGFSPLLIPDVDEGGVHGNNERVSVENIRRGVEMMVEVVRSVAVR